MCESNLMMKQIFNHLSTANSASSLTVSGLDDLNDFVVNQCGLQEKYLVTNAAENIKMKFLQSHMESLSFSSGYHSDRFHVDCVLEGDNFLLTNQSLGHSIWNVRGQETKIELSKLVVLNPYEEFQCNVNEEAIFTTVLLSNAELRRRFSNLVGRTVNQNIVFDTTEVDPFAYTMLRNMMIELQKMSYVKNKVLENKLCKVQLEELFYTLLFTSIPHNFSAELITPYSTVSPWYVKQAKDFIMAHLTEPLKISEISKRLNISTRSLASGFKLYVGQSPVQYIRDQRLKMVHFELQQGTFGTVADVAYKYGFTHMGRFSNYYKTIVRRKPFCNT